MSHSQLPWRASTFQIYAADGSRVAHTGMGQLPPHRVKEAGENAALIVRSANAVGALCLALENAIAALRSSAGPEEKLNAEREGVAALKMAKGGGS